MEALYSLTMSLACWQKAKDRRDSPEQNASQGRGERQGDKQAIFFSGTDLAESSTKGEQCLLRCLYINTDAGQDNDLGYGWMLMVAEFNY